MIHKQPTQIVTEGNEGQPKLVEEETGRIRTARISQGKEKIDKDMDDSKASIELSLREV